MSDRGYHDSFLDGNEKIEAAIAQYYTDYSEESVAAILDTIRERMHADGHLIYAAARDEKDKNRFAFLHLKSKDGIPWAAAFTSYAEYEKGEQRGVVSYFIGNAMKFCLESETEGFVINPWGKSFLLSKEMMRKIFEADEGVEYTVPDDPITAELLEDGSYLKRAIEICIRNRTALNLLKLARILRDSTVWVPCNAVYSDADYERLSKLWKAAQEMGDLDSLTGQMFVNQNEIRLKPDILQKGEEYFFPVFSSEEEMGEYGSRFSKLPCQFPEAVKLARENNKNVAGIVINAFTQPFEIPAKMFDIIAGMESRLEET